MYDHARTLGHQRRDAKFEYAMTKMGETVLAGAVTTAGACAFLLACQVTFFTSMGQLILITIALSCAFALFFFMPLLRLAGPEHSQGNICAAYLAAKRRLTSA